MIKAFGRWSSDCYKIYIRYTDTTINEWIGMSKAGTTMFGWLKTSQAYSISFKTIEAFIRKHPRKDRRWG